MLIIQNISGGQVDIDDLGFSIAPSELIDLSLESEANQVAASAAGGDLEAAINAGTVIVKDPSDGVTSLSTTDSILAARAHNDTHYRMPIAARIADAIDVDLSAPGSYLRFNGTTFERQTPAQVAGEIENEIDITALTNYSANANIDWTVDQSPSVINAANLPSIDHGSLAGLEDNDHPQYVLDAGDVMTGDLELSGASDVIFSGSGGVVVTGTGVIESSFGTVGAPGFTFNTDENTGIYRPANNNLAISAGGQQAAQFAFARNTLNNELRLTDYPNTRDDGSTTKALYVDANGDVRYGDVDVGTQTQQDQAVMTLGNSLPQTFSTNNTFVEMTLDTIDLQNNSAVLDAPTPNRIRAREAGVYLVTYEADFTIDNDTTIEAIMHLSINGTGQTGTSEIRMDMFEDGSVPNQNLFRMNNALPLTLAENDEIGIEVSIIRSFGTGNITTDNRPTLSLIRLSGAKGVDGNPGPTGSGSNINLSDEGTLVSGGPFSLLDFTGTGVTVTDGGSGTATITITGGGGGTPAAPLNAIQYNNNGAFGASADILRDQANRRLEIRGIAAQNQVNIGGDSLVQTGLSEAALYVEVVSAGQDVDGITTYFNRQTPGINGWISYAYSGAAPFIKLVDEDDDSPFINFDVIGAGTPEVPDIRNTFGGAGPVAGARLGFSWKENAKEVALLEDGNLTLTGNRSSMIAQNDSTVQFSRASLGFGNLSTSAEGADRRIFLLEKDDGPGVGESTFIWRRERGGDFLDYLRIFGTDNNISFNANRTAAMPAYGDVRIENGNFIINNGTLQVESGSPQVGQVLKAINTFGNTAWDNPHALAYYHNGATVQTFTTTYVTINFATTVRQDAGYSIANGVVTFTNAGTYEIDYSVGITVASGTSRSGARTRATLNNAEVAGTLAYSYHRQANTGNTGANARFLLTVTAGQQLRIQSQRYNGNGTLTTLANACRLNIKSVV